MCTVFSSTVSQLKIQLRSCRNSQPSRILGKPCRNHTNPTVLSKQWVSFPQSFPRKVDQSGIFSMMVLRFVKDLRVGGPCSASLHFTSRPRREGRGLQCQQVEIERATCVKTWLTKICYGSPWLSIGAPVATAGSSGYYENFARSGGQPEAMLCSWDELQKSRSGWEASRESMGNCPIPMLEFLQFIIVCVLFWWLPWRLFRIQIWEPNIFFARSCPTIRSNANLRDSVTSRHPNRDFAVLLTWLQPKPSCEEDDSMLCATRTCLVQFLSFSPSPKHQPTGFSTATSPWWSPWSSSSISIMDHRKV